MMNKNHLSIQHRFIAITVTPDQLHILQYRRRVSANIIMHTPIHVTAKMNKNRGLAILGRLSCASVPTIERSCDVPSYAQSKSDSIEKRLC